MSFIKTNIEQLPPSEISQQLRERVAKLNAVLDLKLRALKKAPEGNLRISQCRGDVQYYHRKSPDDERGHYLDATHYELAQSLAQKDYNQRLVKSLKNELKILQGALRQLEKITASNESSDTVINLLHPLRRALITTATLTDEQYAAACRRRRERATRPRVERDAATGREYNVFGLTAEESLDNFPTCGVVRLVNCTLRNRTRECWPQNGLYYLVGPGARLELPNQTNDPTVPRADFSGSVSDFNPYPQVTK